ncbi:hypothetical protein PR048_028444, partial [Dryococelus australis]
MRAELLHDLPPGYEGHANGTGSMNSELFVAYFQHFANHVKPSKICQFYFLLITIFRMCHCQLLISRNNNNACGIEPYSPQIFAEEDFARSATFERDIQAEPSHDQQTIAWSGQQAAAVENYLLLQHIIMQPGRSHQQDRQEVVPDEAENRTHISQANYNENGTVANRPRATKQKRPNIYACILTSTPWPGREEEFVDSPDEDWMKCGTCEQWWHEKCSSYEGCGQF